MVHAPLVSLRSLWEGDEPIKPVYSLAGGLEVLTNVLIPLLTNGTTYDRGTGYFSATLFSHIGNGLRPFIERGGKMRLLMSVHVQEDLRMGLIGEERVRTPKWEQLPGHPRESLNLVLWMIKTGDLEIRIVRKTDGEGIFHTKIGIVGDGQDHVLFDGSVNETQSGWTNNLEHLNVYGAWRNDDDKERIRHHQERFEAVWNNTEAGWETLPLPEAIQAEWIDWVEKEVRDGTFIAVGGEPTPTPDPQDSRAARQFLSDLPQLAPHGNRIGQDLLPFPLWPHQESTVEEVVTQFPRPYLIADEVGLGKTLQALVSLRRLWLQGRVRRALIIVPSSLVKQWWQDLSDIVRLPATKAYGKNWDAALRGQRCAAQDFTGEGIWLVSAHTAKGKGPQRESILKAAKDQRWDMVILDEAHHARRRGSLGAKQREPNTLLSFLQDLTPSTKGLLLLTATPMQLAPTELWDLLSLFGLPGQWGAGNHTILGDFFERVAKWGEGSSTQLQWLLSRVSEVRSGLGLVDKTSATGLENRLGRIHWRRFSAALTNDSAAAAQELSQVATTPEGLQDIQVFLWSHTPIRAFMRRATRKQLLDYKARGLFSKNLATRDVRVVPMEMAPAFKELYDGLEEVIHTAFGARRDVPENQTAFVRTIYQQRLASSLQAYILSLERLLSRLETGGDWIDDDERESVGDLPVGDVDEAGIAHCLRDARGAIEATLHRARQLSPEDDRRPKELQELLHSGLSGHNQILIFTQYKDTLCWLKEQLKVGRTIGCFSGEGGEIWKDGSWRKCNREHLQARFQDKNFQILLATDAASEGLNLQCASAVINYDLPWNPMRVEQRIGRVDRIGQERTEVAVRHILYKGTLEDHIYSVLAEREDTFEIVVGGLQPLMGKFRSEKAGTITDGEGSQAAKRRLAKEIEKKMEEWHRTHSHMVEVSAWDTETLPVASRGDWHRVVRKALGQPIKEEPAETSLGQGSMVKWTSDLWEGNKDRLPLVWCDPVWETWLDECAMPPPRTGYSKNRYYRKKGPDGAVKWWFGKEGAWLPLENLSSFFCAETGPTEPPKGNPTVAWNVVAEGKEIHRRLNDNIADRKTTLRKALWEGLRGRAAKGQTLDQQSAEGLLADWARESSTVHGAWLALNPGIWEGFPAEGLQPQRLGRTGNNKADSRVHGALQDLQSIQALFLHPSTKREEPLPLPVVAAKWARMAWDADVPDSEGWVPFFEDVAVAAGHLEGLVGVEEVMPTCWVQVPHLDGRTLNPAEYVAVRIVGDSMEPTLPDGSYQVFRRYSPVAGGTRQGKTMLIGYQTSTSADWTYVVKRYKRISSVNDETDREKVIVSLESFNTDYDPIVLEGLTDGDVATLAELILP